MTRDDELQQLVLKLTMTDEEIHQRGLKAVERLQRQREAAEKEGVKHAALLHTLEARAIKIISEEIGSKKVHRREVKIAVRFVQKMKQFPPPDNVIRDLFNGVEIERILPKTKDENAAIKKLKDTLQSLASALNNPHLNK